MIIVAQAVIGLYGRPLSSCHGVATRQPSGAHAPKGHPAGLEPLEQGLGPFAEQFSRCNAHSYFIYIYCNVYICKQADWHVNKQ